MSPLTVSVPILGAHTSAGALLSLSDLLWLGVVGLAAHLFGFALNDLLDQALDRTLPWRKQQPLLTGQLSPLTAWWFTLSQVPIALGVYALALNGRGAGLALLGLSIVASVLYNTWGKRGTIPRLVPELALAASIGLLCLAGALVGGESTPLTLGNGLFALTLALILLLVNSVPSGLKDLRTDSEFGVRTFVLATGSRMLDEDAMALSGALVRHSLGLQALIMIGLAGAAIWFRVAWYAALLIAMLALYGWLHLRMLLSLRSFVALRRAMPLLNGHYNYFALSLCVTPAMPLGLQLCFAVGIVALLSVPLRWWLRAWRNRHHY